MNQLLTTKNEVIAAFGSAADAARAIGVSKQYISKWPSELPRKLSYWATGALVAKEQGVNQLENPNGTECQDSTTGIKRYNR